MAGKDAETIYREFNDAVNMAPAELADWLQTEESRSVGIRKRGSSESVGHESGRRIVEIKRTRKAELSHVEYDHMKKVVGYVRRHLAQRPQGDVADTRWRHALMNWGHDPLKD